MTHGGVYHLNCSFLTSFGLANLAVSFSRQMRQLSGFSTFLFCIKIYSAILPSSRYSALEFEKLRLLSSSLLPSPNRQTKLARLNLSLQPSSIHSCVSWKEALSAGSCYGSAMAMISCWKRYQQLPTMNLGQFLLTLVRVICPWRMVRLRMRRWTVKKSFSSCMWQYYKEGFLPTGLQSTWRESNEKGIQMIKSGRGLYCLMSAMQDRGSSSSGIKSKQIIQTKPSLYRRRSFLPIRLVTRWKKVFIFKFANTFFKTFGMFIQHHIITSPICPFQEIPLPITASLYPCSPIQEGAPPSRFSSLKGEKLFQNISLELHPASEEGVAESCRILLDGDEVIEHLAALALLHYQLQRLLADGTVEHPRVQKGLLFARRTICLPEGFLEVFQVEPALHSSLFGPEDHLLQGLGVFLVESLEAGVGEFGVELAEEEGGVVGAAAKALGVHDATSFDLEFCRGGLGERLFCLLALGEDLVVDGLVCLEGEEGVVHSQRKLFIDGICLSGCIVLRSQHFKCLNKYLYTQYSQKSNGVEDMLLGGSWFGEGVSLHCDFSEVFQVPMFLLDVAHETEEIFLFLHQLSLVQAGSHALQISDGGFGPAAAPSMCEFTILYHLQQIWVVLLDIIGQLFVLISMDIEEGRHEDQFLDLGVVVPIVEKLIQSITGLLRLSHEQEVMLDFFLSGRLDILE